MNLIDTWLKAGKASGLKTNTAVLDKLNADLDMNIQNNRVYEWRSGVQRPPIEVVNYMIGFSLLFVLRKFKPRIKLTNDEVKILSEMLSIPEKDRKK